MPTVSKILGEGSGWFLNNLNHACTTKISFFRIFKSFWIFDLVFKYSALFLLLPIFRMFTNYLFRYPNSLDFFHHCMAIFGNVHILVPEDLKVNSIRFWRIKCTGFFDNKKFCNQDFANIFENFTKHVWFFGLCIDCESNAFTQLTPCTSVFPVGEVSTLKTHLTNLNPFRIIFFVGWSWSDASPQVPPTHPRAQAGPVHPLGSG